MPENNENSPNAGYNTQADEFNSVYKGPSITNPGQTKTQHNVPVTSIAENTPRGEIRERALRKKRLSFGGGNDGRGSPMFANLETARGSRVADRYEDQKPADGFLGAAFKKFINTRTGAAVSGGK